MEEEMPSAVALYRSLGFVEIASCTVNPVKSAIYMELLLAPEPDAD